MANNFPAVKLDGKEIAAHFRRKRGAMIDLETAVGNGGKEGNRRQNGVELQVGDSAVDGVNRILAFFQEVNQSIAHAAFRQLVPGVRPDDAAIRQEYNFDQVLEASGDGFD